MKNSEKFNEKFNDKHMEKFTDKNSEKFNDKNVEKFSDKNMEKFTDKNMEKFTDKNMEKPTEKDENSEKKQLYEDLIFENLRVFERERRFDSVCFTGVFLRDFEHVLEIFSLISDKGLFTHACKLDIPLNDWLWEMPFWFNLNSFQSLATWIVGLMEREIWKKFFLAKQLAKRKSSGGFVVQDSMLSKQTDIMEFWSSLDKPNRRKVSVF